MPHFKNTNLFSEIDVFFQNSDDSAINAMLNALKAIKMTDTRLGLSLPLFVKQCCTMKSRHRRQKK